MPREFRLTLLPLARLVVIVFTVLTLTCNPNAEPQSQPASKAQFESTNHIRSSIHIAKKHSGGPDVTVI